MRYSQMVVEGQLLYETKTHYVTRTDSGISTWSKDWYRLSFETNSMKESLNETNKTHRGSATFQA